MSRSIARLGASTQRPRPRSPARLHRRNHRRSRAHRPVWHARGYPSGQKGAAPGESGLAQLRLAEPVALLPGDRFILRQFSPVVTIAGGSVLDAAPQARRISAAEHSAFLRSLQSLSAARTAGRAHPAAPGPWIVARRCRGRNRLAACATRAAGRGPRRKPNKSSNSAKRSSPPIHSRARAPGC